MEKTNMKEMVIKELGKRGYITEETTVVKNGVEKKGLIYGKPGSTIRPCVYLESFLEGKESKSVEEVVDELENFINDAPPCPVSELTDADFVKKHAILCVQRPGTEQIVKRPRLDMEEYIRVLIGITSDRNASYKLNAGIFSDEVVEEIFAAAEKNTLADVGVGSLFSTLKSLNPEIAEEFSETKLPSSWMLIVSNSRKINGAVFLPDVYKSICEKKGVDGCIVLPSSIHETLVNFDASEEELEKLSDMVSQVNDTEVAAEEQLSDHGYWYDLETNSFRW